MSLVNAAYNLITRFGFQDSAFLIRKSSNVSYNKSTMQYEGSSSSVGMYAYVNGYPSSRVNNKTILADDRRILARIDSNFDGNVSKGDRVKVNGKEMGVIRSEFFTVGSSVAYVEIQARG